MTKSNTQIYKAVVMGASAGGVEIFGKILPQVREDFALAIIIAQHIADHEGSLIDIFYNNCSLKVKEANHHEKIMSGTIYFAPADYHLYIETNKTFSLSVDNRVNYSRPSIDLLFESAAKAYQEQLIAIIFSGTNQDGANGLKQIKQLGGCTIVQDPKTAYSPIMPLAALEVCEVDYILDVKGIIDFINQLY